MARKEKYITVEKENRDHGKMFFIREMPADKSERWGLRALGALIGSGAHIPDNVKTLGMAALVHQGILSLSRVPVEVSLPLLDELLDCVEIVPDPSNKDIKRKDIKNDIEEAWTYSWLRMEVLKLHLDFFNFARD